MKNFKSKNSSEKEPKRDSAVKTILSNLTKKSQTSDADYADKNENISSNVTKKEPLISEDDVAEEKKIPESVFSKKYFKRRIDKKLTIILIENTSKVAIEKDRLIKLIKNYVSSELVSVITYDSNVRKTEIFDAYNFNKIDFLSSQNTEGNVCLFDALVELESLVSNSYMKVEEKEDEDIRINKVEIIGIGTCKDNCSKASKEVAIDCFCKVAKKSQITTKYYCLTEKSFIQAAEIGFHSIGAIFRNYQ